MPGLLAGSNDWSFSLRGNCPDSDGDDEGLEISNSSEAQLLQTLDLSSREDAAQFNPNPWSIAKVNAASCPPPPPPLYKPASSVKHKKPEQHKQTSLDQAFSKQVASRVQPSTLSRSPSKLKTLSGIARRPVIHKPELLSSPELQRVGHSSTSTTAVPSHNTDVNARSMPNSLKFSATSPVSKFCEPQRLNQLQLQVNPTLPVMSGISPIGLANGASAKISRPDPYETSAHIGDKSALPKQHLFPSHDQVVNTPPHPIKSAKISGAIPSFPFSPDVRTRDTLSTPRKGGIVLQSGQPVDSAGISLQRIRHLKVSPQPPRNVLTQPLATTIRLDPNIQTPFTPSPFCNRQSTPRLFSPGLPASLPLTVESILDHEQPSAEHALLSSIQTYHAPSDAHAALIAPKEPLHNRRFSKVLTDFPETQSARCLLTKTRERSSHFESAFLRSASSSPSPPLSPTNTLKRIRPHIASAPSRPRRPIVTAYASLKDPDEDMWSTLPVRKKQKHKPETFVRTTGKFMLPFSVSTRSGDTLRERKRPSMYRPPPANAGGNEASILKLRRVGNQGVQILEATSKQGSPQGTSEIHDKNKVTVAIEQDVDIPMLDSSPPSSPSPNIPLPFSIQKIEKTYSAIRNVVSERKRSSNEAFEMLNLESCGVVSRDDAANTDIEILKWGTSST